MIQTGSEGIHKQFLLTTVAICWIIHLHTQGVVAISDCISKNQTGRITCSVTERIDIKSLLFMVLDNVTDQYVCSTNIKVPKCNGIISTTKEGADHHLVFLCAGLMGQCGFLFDRPPSKVEPGCDLQAMANVVQVDYSCIPEYRFINLCEDGRTDSSGTVHLAYFQSPRDDPKQECSCVIIGAVYRLRAVSVFVPKVQRGCPSSSLLIQGGTNRITYNTSTSRGITLVNDILVLGEERIQLDYRHNCDSSNWVPIWFKLEPTNPGANRKINIICGLNASGSFSSQTLNHSISDVGTITTTAILQGSTLPNNYSSIIPHIGGSLASTPSTDETSPTSDVAVIAGSVIGGVLFLIIIIVCTTILCRKHRGKRNNTRNSTYLSYNEGVGGNSQVSGGNTGDHHYMTLVYNTPAVNGVSNNNAAFVATVQ